MFAVFATLTLPAPSTNASKTMELSVNHAEISLMIVCGR